MKKTNGASSHVAAKWAKLLPIVFCFFLVGTVQLSAQDFRPADDAREIVEEALKDLPSPLQLEANVTVTQAQNDQVDRMKTGVYSQFLSELKESSDTEQAFEAVKDYLKVDRLRPRARKDLMEEVFTDLEELITS